MTDSVKRSVNLFLSQTGEVIYGTGNMTSGNITQQAAAFGTIAATQLSLKLISFADFNLYQLTLDLKTPLIQGDYKAVSPKNQYHLDWISNRKHHHLGSGPPESIYIFTFVSYMNRLNY